MWQCARCETLNEDERPYCLICKTSLFESRRLTEEGAQPRRAARGTDIRTPAPASASTSAAAPPQPTVGPAPSAPAEEPSHAWVLIAIISGLLILLLWAVGSGHQV